MTMTAAPLFAAIRLTDVGLAVILAAILFDRIRERVHWWRNEFGSNASGMINIDAIIFTGMCFVASAFVVLTLPLAHYLFQWPPQSRVPQPLIYLTIVLRGCAATAMIFGLAHNPRRQLLCCIGWTLAVHTFILGPAIWTQVH